MDKVREALETARRRLVIAARFAGNDDDVAEASVSFIDAALASLPASDADVWRTMDSAPRDGTPIQAKIPGHGADNIIAWASSLLDSEGKDCGGWQFVEDQEPPDDWTDGVCWQVNEDGVASTQPVAWRPLPTPPRSLPTGGDDA